MTALNLSLPLSLGIVSSLHCMQMCGPIVLCIGRGSVLDHFAYHAGRILTYCMLGAIGGAVGHGIVRIAGIEQIAAIVAGALMIVAGLLAGGFAPRRVLVGIERMGVSRLFSRTVGGLLASPSAGGRLALGVMMGFLPCGVLYAALLNAVSTASVALGAVSMLCFGVGTAGALVALGIFSSFIKLRLSRWSAVLAAISITAMGVFLVWRGLAAKVPGMACHPGM